MNRKLDKNAVEIKSYCQIQLLKTEHSDSQEIPSQCHLLYTSVMQ